MKKITRFFAMLLAVLMFTAALPMPETHVHALSSGGVASIPVGALSPENYYRLLYANNMLEFDDLLFDYETVDFEFKELTDNERLVSLYKDATMALNISGLVLGFMPKVGPLLKEACKAGVSWIQRETTFKTFAEIPKRLNELGTQMDDLYDALVNNLDNQTREILNGLEALENKVDIEKYVDALIAFNKNDFDSFGGYYQWKEKLFSAYDEVLLYQNSSSVTDEDMKEAFDALYVAAEKSSVLYNAMIGGQYPEDYSVQEALFNYYLLKNAIHGESVDLAKMVNSCVDFSQDLYTSYVFSQICMNLCYQYQVEYMKKEYGNDLTTKSYYLSETVNSKDRRISYHSVIKPFIENGSENLENIETELSQYYAIVLNLCESYYSFSDGQMNRVVYNELMDENPGHGFSVTKEGALERFVVCNNRVGVGDILYLNPVPMILTSSFGCNYTFISNHPSVAEVTADGVVTVKTQGDFSVTLKYGDSVVYTMYFASYDKFSGGSGSATSPYLLSSESDLIALTNNSDYWKKGYHFKMIRDIHISNVPQIGSASKPFYGVFDGNGYTISGANQSAKALFGVNYGTIKNLTVSGAHISAGFREALSNTRGGICDGNAGLIENVHLIASTIDSENYSDNISPGGNRIYTSVATHIGGIAGENEGIIRKCTVKNSDFSVYQRNGTHTVSFLGVAEVGAPDISYVNMGAIAGTNTGNGIIEDCLSTGNDGYTYIHSVSGYAKNLWADAIIHICVASFRMGGLVGEDYGILTRSVAYNNSFSKDWTYDTKNDVDIFNDKKYHQKEEVYINAFVGYERGDAGLCLSNTETSQDKISQMTNAGWVWSSKPYFDVKGISGISVQKRPTKMAYAKNSALNISGLVLQTEKGEYITEGYTVSSCDTSSYGTKTVEVEWNGMKTSFEVEVVCFHENIDVVDSADDVLNEDIICLDCGQRLYILEDSGIQGHEHKWENYESVDDVNHKTVCACDEILTEPHNFKEEIIKEATHTEKGEKLLTCKVCGYKKTEVIPENKDAHSYDDGYETHNKNQHKVFCECGEYILKAHSWDYSRAVETKPATHMEKGEKTIPCEHCGETKIEEIAKLTAHTYTYGYESTNAVQHKAICECGAYILNVHDWDSANAVAIKFPTHLAEGEKQIFCKDCGEMRTESIPKTETHTYAIFEKLNDIQHKAICECGSFVYVNHNWDESSAVITKKATHTENGEKLISCKDCGLIKTESIEKLPEHTFGQWTPSGNGQHSHSCICGEEEKNVCVWNDGVVTQKPTYTKQGVQVFTCTVCGFEKMEKLPVLPVKTEVTSDDNKIKVEVQENSSAILDANTILQATQTGSDVYGKTRENLSALYGKTSTVLAAYDISLLLDGASVQPNGKVAVTLPAPHGMEDYDRFQVVCIADDCTVTECETKVNADGSVTFITDHFSVYAIVGIRSSVNWIPIAVIGAVLLIGAATIIVVVSKKRKRGY